MNDPMVLSFPLPQQTALAIVPKISGWTSMIFSSLIVYKILTNPQRKSKVYHRLICGISMADTLSSFWLGMSTWPMPRDSGVLWAIGTTTTCQLQGFFTQTRIVSTFYNASLSLYFLFTIKYGWKETQLRRIEWWLHGIPLAWALLSASLGLALGAFGDADLWCGSTSDMYRWISFYGPLWVMIFLISINCLLILQHVRRIEAATDRRHQSTILEYSVPQSPVPVQPKLGKDGNRDARTQRDRNLSTGGSEDTFSAPSNPVDPTKVDNNGVSDECLAETDLANQNGRTTAAVDVVADAADTAERGDRIVRRSDFTRQDSGGHSNESLTPFSLAAARCNSGRKVSFLRRRSSDRLAPDQLRLKRTRQVARQTFWYASAFYFNWTALSISRAIQAINGQVYFPLLLVAAITVPIQGLPTFLVYVGPSANGCQSRIANWVRHKWNDLTTPIFSRFHDNPVMDNDTNG